MAKGKKSKKAKASRNAMAVAENARAASATATATALIAEGVRMQRMSRFNPIRTLTPETLAMALDSFEAGDLATLSLLFDAIAKRCDTTASVKAKREKDTAQRDWQVLTVDDSPEAKRHAEVLEFFYNNLTATNAYDRNERGGFSRLVRQMMEAVSTRYAVHHIVWEPRAEGLTARLEFVPLWFFENQTGELRFVKEGWGIEGDELKDGEWMVTYGDGIMMSVAIAYTMKRLALHDLINFSEKFGFPGVLGKTSAAKDSDAGRAMHDAVQTFGSEWGGVIYGDEGSGSIELIKADGGTGSIPMPMIVERMDRKIAALYRGADLSSMSSKEGEGTGASLQAEEGDILARDDAQMITEALNHYIDRHVLRYHFGPKVRGLAYVQVSVPESEDQKFTLDAIKALVPLGVPFAVDATLEHFGFPTPEEGDVLLGAAPTPETPEPNDRALDDPEATSENARRIAANAVTAPAMESFLADARSILGEKVATVLQEVSPLLLDALDEEDGPAFEAALQLVQAALPELMRTAGVDAEAADSFERVFAASFFNGLTDEAPNPPATR